MEINYARKSFSTENFGLVLVARELERGEVKGIRKLLFVEKQAFGLSLLGVSL